jgi:hypothetical protein
MEIILGILAIIWFLGALSGGLTGYTGEHK